jgi:branched-chain amino acid transport system substrate-binding protein
MKRIYLAALAALFFVCFTVLAPKAGNAENVIKIGGILTTSGPAAHLGKTTLNGVKIAEEEINANGGIEINNQQYKIEFINYDDKCSAKDAVSAAQRLVEKDRVKAIVGAICSHSTLAFMDYIKAKKVPTITPIAASMKVTNVENQYMFRTGAQTGMQSETITRYAMEEMGLKKAAFIGRNDSWSHSAASQFKKRVKERGGTITAVEFFELGSTDFYSQLTKVKQTRPDFIWLVALSEDGGLLLKQARELSVDAALFGTDEFSNEYFYEIAGDAANGAYFYWGGGPGKEIAKDYEKEYKKEYGIKSLGFDKIGYDTLKLLADAIERADSLDGEKIRDAVQTADYTGIRGHYAFTETGQAKTEMWIAKVEDFETKFIKMIDVYENPVLPVDRELE